MNTELEIQIQKSKLALNKGGPGSGNFGHAGRPGQVGGSASSEGGEEGGLDQITMRTIYSRLRDEEKFLREGGYIDEGKGYRKAVSDVQQTIRRTGTTSSGLKETIRSLKGRWKTLSSVELRSAAQRKGYRQAIIDFGEAISEGG